jgi:5-methylcytosine-specific restriction endonuclease McrA
MKITEAMFKKLKTARGGFTQQQIAYCKALGFKPGRLKGKDLTEYEYQKLLSLRGQAKTGAERPKILNKVSKADGWAWQPDPQDVPPIRKPKSERAQKRAQKAYSKDFYQSPEWRMLRVRVLEKYECKCMMCGRSPKAHGIAIHVDHIKPISKAPELCLEFNNLQLLCEDCNLGKSNKYDTDWRPAAEEQDDAAELEIAYQARQWLG